MNPFIGFLAAITLYALAVQKATDFVRNTLDKADTWPKWSWIAVAFGFGVLWCLLTGFNQVATLTSLQPGVAGHLTGVWGQVFTGLGIGGAASYWHERSDASSSAAKASRAQIGTSTQS